MNEFANLHPFAPKEQAQGYWEMFAEITEYVPSLPTAQAPVSQHACVQ